MSRASGFDQTQGGSAMISSEYVASPRKALPMTAVLTDYLDFWDVALFCAVPLGLMIYTIVQKYRAH
jgi:hypothetical protein